MKTYTAQEVQQLMELASAVFLAHVGHQKGSELVAHAMSMADELPRVTEACIAEAEFLDKLDREAENNRIALRRLYHAVTDDYTYIKPLPELVA